MTMTPDLWLFVDNEGCMTPGKGVAWDVAGMIEVRRQLAQRKSWRLVITTGRSAPYTEALWQFIGCPPGPHIVEGGGLLYWPESGAIEKLGPDWDRELVQSKLLTLPFDFEAGKVNCISLYPRHGSSIEWLPECKKVLGKLADDLELVCSSAAIDVTARGVNKGAAVSHVRQRFGSLSARAVTFGDGFNDLSMHDVADIAACPANALAGVSERCDFVSPRQQVWGLLDLFAKLDDLVA